MKRVLLNRRSVLAGTAIAAMGTTIGSRDVHGSTSLRESSRGLVVGSLLGDAMGGPLEFADERKRRGNVVGARQWDESKRLDQDLVKQIADSAVLMSYEKVRPTVAAYGPWLADAPAGTVTDDSRWKIILIRAIRKAIGEGVRGLTQAHVAEAILEFQPEVGRRPDQRLQQLVDEGLQEYRYAANWVLGRRDPEVALPLDRLWAGIPNCSGQMMLLPLAISYAGDPDAAYRKTFELDFIDSAGAKSIAASIVAALAAVLGAPASSSVQERWDKCFQTLRNLDPFRLKDVPFAGRPLDKWLNLVDGIVARADGRPAVAYRLLETEGKPVYYWDAHFTLVVALTLLKLCEYDPMCSLAVAIDFGHDTDSYAQLIGAFAGAIYGEGAFPKPMRQTIESRLEAEYGEDIDDWMSLLSVQ